MEHKRGEQKYKQRLISIPLSARPWPPPESDLYFIVHRCIALLYFALDLFSIVHRYITHLYSALDSIVHLYISLLYTGFWSVPLFIVALLCCILLRICFSIVIRYITLLYFGSWSVLYCSSLHESSVFWLLVCTLLFIVTSLYSITWRATSIELYLIVHCCFASLYSCIILACRSIIVVLLHFSMMKNLNVTNFLKLDKTNENHS